MTRKAIVRWARDRRDKYMRVKRIATALTAIGLTWGVTALLLPLLLFSPERDFFFSSLATFPFAMALLLVGVSISGRLSYVPPVEDQIEHYCGPDGYQLLRPAQDDEHLLRAL